MTKPLLLTIVATAMLAVPSVRAALDAEPTTTKHLSLTTSTSVSTVAPGGRVSLVVEITPKPNMHVYAPGQPGYVAIVLTLDPDAPVRAAGKAKYPAGEKLFMPVLNETQLVYGKPFRITQDVALPRASSGPLTVKGSLRYQACDDKICYKPVSVPVAWTLPRN